jgi:hypothetical protein
MHNRKNRIVGHQQFLGSIAALVAAFALSEPVSAADISLSEATCSALNGLTIGAARIGLPSGEAKMASAVMMPSVAAGTNSQGQPTPASRNSAKFWAQSHPSIPQLRLSIFR